jgi:hypothetical protein
MKGFAIVFGLALTPVLSVTAYAACAEKYAECSEVVVYECRDGMRGTQDFVGGSDFGQAHQIALGKARQAGYKTRNCSERVLHSEDR